MPVHHSQQTVVATLTGLLLCAAASAQTVAPPPVGVVDLQASAQVEVVPDLAVMTLAAERSGTDPASLTAQVSKTLEAALQQARTVPGVQASSGGLNTQPRWKTVNNQSQRDGWTVHAELILKSHDAAALGKLAGQLAQQGLMIESNSFEVSRALREREETALIESAIARFKAKATTAAHALGYAAYTLRSLQIDPLQGPTPPPYPMRMRAEAAIAADSAPAVPLAAGRLPLQLNVHGSIQLIR